MLTFGLIVTDNLGAQSTQDSIIVTVNPAAASDFSESFENGSNGAAITSSNTTYSSITGTPTFTTEAAVGGALSAKFVGLSIASSTAQQNLPSTATTRYFRRYFRVSGLPAGSVILKVMLEAAASNWTTKRKTIAAQKKRKKRLAGLMKIFLRGRSDYTL